MDELATYTVTDEPPGELIMTLTGAMLDGMPIIDTDTVRIINKEYDGS